MKFIPATRPPEGIDGPGLLFALAGGRLLIRSEDADGPIIPGYEELSKTGIEFHRQHFIGTLVSRPCYAAAIDPETPLPSGFSLKPLRALFSRLDEGEIWAAGRANQLIDWEMTHAFCGACGHRLEDKADEQAKACPQCGLVNYPRITPAVIVSVTRDERILLARNRLAKIPFYSVLAGFVEPSETLEECVEREVGEEVGISVRNIRYFGSQPWPFPNSLMIGFTAEHEAGEIKIDRGELSDAGWFARGELPQVPPPLSIAGRLIRWFEKGLTG
jgi:NAD+ diphosphatase